MIVYKVTSPSGKCYIGITSKTLEFRKVKHYNELKNQNTNYKFHHAIRKYGDQLCWEVVDNSAQSFEELKELEMYYIQLFDSYNNGYNCTLGGDGTKGWYHTEESRAKMRGLRPQTSRAMLGKKKSEEHKKKISETRLSMNIKIDESTKYKISESLKKRNSNIEIRNKAALVGGGKSFFVFKKETEELIGEWISQRQCARDLNLGQSNIGKCLRYPDRHKDHKGFTFKYKEET